MNTPLSSATTGGAATSPGATPPKSQVVALALSWTAVGLPLLWGVAETLRKALALFH